MNQAVLFIFIGAFLVILPGILFFFTADIRFI